MSGFKPDIHAFNRRFIQASFVLMTTAVAGFFVACGGAVSEEGFNSALHSKYLYVASGSCYAGGATVSTGNSTIAKYDLETGAFAGLVADYNVYGNGDSPTGLGSLDSSRLLVAVENAAGRRIDVLNRDGSGLTTYISNATALSTVLRHLTVLPDSSILVTKSTAIEKFSNARARILQSANPFINAPAAPCAASITAMTSTTILPNGKIIFTHAAASPNNITGVISNTGYATAANCLAGQAAPVTTALPTASAYDAITGKLLVAYGSATTASNLIYAYNINVTSGAISTPVAAWTDNGIVNGPTYITVDPDTGLVYVANGASTINNIEKFSLSTGGVLTKVGNAAYIGTSVYTRCITAMEIGP